MAGVVGSASAPLLRYAPGGFEQITVPNEHGGERTLVLINDATSPRSYRFPLNVPEGGHATKNPDGSISVFDAAGREVTHYGLGRSAMVPRQAMLKALPGFLIVRCAVCALRLRARRDSCRPVLMCGDPKCRCEVLVRDHPRSQLLQ